MSIISLVIHFCSVIDQAVFVKAAIQLAFFGRLQILHKSRVLFCIFPHTLAN